MERREWQRAGTRVHVRLARMELMRAVEYRITVYIAADHPHFLRGVRGVMQENERYLLHGEAGDGEAALREIRSLHPAVAVLDVEMPDKSDLDVARALQEEQRDTAVIIPLAGAV